MSLAERLDGLQRRHPAAGYPLGVVYKFVDDTGGHLAALLTYYGFLSLFPLLLLGSTVLGLVLRGDPQAQQAVLDTALRQFPVIGREIDEPSRLGGGAVGLVVGGLGALYGGLGVSLAFQNALNTAWRVPRNDRPNPLAARARGLLLLVVLGVAVLVTTLLSALGSGAGALAPALRGLSVLGSLVLNTGVLVVAFRVGTARPLGVRDVLPGAAAAAVVWQLLQSFGAPYVARVVRGAGEVNSVFALVLGLLSFLYVAAVAVVLCVEADVVRVLRLWPRALLTPFTDDVELTASDERAYTTQAQAQRSKGFQEIDVRFGPH